MYTYLNFRDNFQSGMYTFYGTQKKPEDKRSHARPHSTNTSDCKQVLQQHLNIASVLPFKHQQCAIPQQRNCALRTALTVLQITCLK